MALINLLPQIDALTGSTATPARFYAERRRAKRPTAYVAGPVVTVPKKLQWTYDGTRWDETPTLPGLPVEEYWYTGLIADSFRLERNVSGVGLDDLATIDYGALAQVVPDTSAIDVRTSQLEAAQQSMAALLAAMSSLAATVTDSSGAVQGQLAGVQSLIDQANAALAGVATAQALAEAAADRATAAADATSVDVDTKLGALADVARSGDYYDLANIPAIPTAVSVPDSLPPAGPAGGFLGGSYPNPGVNAVALDNATAGRINDGTSATSQSVRTVVAGLIAAGGGTSSGGSSAITYAQVSPASTWTIPHQFGRFPLVETYDSVGERIEPDVEASTSSVSLIFAIPMAGTAVLS